MLKREVCRAQMREGWILGLGVGAIVAALSVSLFAVGVLQQENPPRTSVSRGTTVAWDSPITYGDPYSNQMLCDLGYVMAWDGCLLAPFGAGKHVEMDGTPQVDRSTSSTFSYGNFAAGNTHIVGNLTVEGTITVNGKKLK